MRSSTYHPAADLVVLVPGFLGYEQLSSHPYFDEVLIDALRQALQARRHTTNQLSSQASRGACFAVETLSTVPAGSLLQRQAAIVSELSELLEHPSHFEVERLHLIGHGTGGLDARLLLADRRLDGRLWARPENELRSRIRSVLCIAAPQHGTRLVAHPDLRALSRSLPRFLLQRASDAELWSLATSGLRDMATADVLRLALRRPAQAWSLVASIAEHDDLLRDLSPEAMVRHRHALPRLPNVQFGSIVTLAADHLELPATPVRRGVFGRLDRYVREMRSSRAAPNARRGDPIFRWLRARTANPCWEVDDASDARIEDRAARRIQAVLEGGADGLGVPLISHPNAVWPCPVDGRVNDGIVNSVRQLLRPEDDDELLAVVVADHLDVVGHFDKVPRPRHAEDHGLIRSGSGFSHEQLHAMCALLAERIDSVRLLERADSGIVSSPPARAAAP
ncbi:MAG: hypothetical protein OXU20_26785 [Myxococcales bacterium]|nr:hypothetical protein [Myxococcales bacterium]MDD9970697.1 hypothetical protein [Myxococcales bacterium]